MAEKYFNLETFLRAYIDLTKNPNCKGWYMHDFRDFWNKVEQIFLWENPKEWSKEEFLSRYSENLPQSVQNIIVMVQAARGNSEAQQDISNTMKFVAEQVYNPMYDSSRYGSSQYYDNTAYAQMFLNRLKKFQDPKLVYDAVSLLKQAVSYKRPCAYKNGHNNDDIKRKALYHDIAVMMASNEHAQLKDLTEMIYWAENAEQAEKIINDVFAKTDEMIDLEMKKDVPSSDAIKGVVWNPSDVVRIARGNNSDANPEYDVFLEGMYRKDKRASDAFYERLNQWARLAMDKYDFDKIMGSGDQAYVTTYGDTLEKRNIDLENENTKVKDENRRVVQANDALRRNADLDKAEIERLKEKIEKLQQELANEKNAKARAQDKVRKFSEAATAVEQAGAFKRGDALKVLKQVNESSNEI